MTQLRDISERRVRIDSHLDELETRTLPPDVLEGLTRAEKELPPKHFYDGYGSELFERICELPEYYPTRTERKILTENAAAIAAISNANDLVELGAGSATKTRLLLDALTERGSLRRYVPVDVSETAVRGTAEALAVEYEQLEIHGVVGDFERHLGELPNGNTRLFAFLGGTIGNFPPMRRLNLLRAIATNMGPDDMLLLGTDLVKEPAIIERAYNDSEGVTAEFNRNVLRVINRELDGNFDLDLFEHRAIYDRQNEWIEMRLRATSECTVRIEKLSLDVHFANDEEIRTEISAKFTPARVESDLSAVGLQLDQWFTDSEDLFALSLARPTQQ